MKRANLGRNTRFLYPTSVVVPFGSGSLRESGGNRRGYGLGGRRIQIKASYEIVGSEEKY